MRFAFSLALAALAAHLLTACCCCYPTSPGTFQASLLAPQANAVAEAVAEQGLAETAPREQKF